MANKEPQVLDFLPHTPTGETRQLVSQLVACDIDHESICFVIKATPFELKQFYADELKHGLASCIAQMQESVFRAGVGGDMKAAQFWLMSRAGWRPAPKVEVVESNKQQTQDKQQLIDRIVALLTPEQAARVMVAEQEAATQPAPTGARLN